MHDVDDRSNAVSEPKEGTSQKLTRSVIQLVERGRLVQRMGSLVAPACFQEGLMTVQRAKESSTLC